MLKRDSTTIFNAFAYGEGHSGAGEASSMFGTSEDNGSLGPDRKEEEQTTSSEGTARRTGKFMKYGLPLNVWASITRMLRPEENIKLTLVNPRDFELLTLTNGNAFLFHPEEVFQQPIIPEWYCRDGFYLSYKPWRRCPSAMRRRFFSAITGIRIAYIEAECAYLPIEDLLILFRGSLGTMKELIIKGSEALTKDVFINNHPEMLFSSRLPLLMHSVSSKMRRNPNKAFSNLTSMVLEGPHVLEWVIILRYYRFEALNMISVVLPSISERSAKGKPVEPNEYSFGAVARFFSNLVKLEVFFVSAEPHDSTAEYYTLSCLQWLATTSPTSRSVQKVVLRASELRPVFGVLHKHLTGLVIKDGGNVDLLHDRDENLGSAVEDLIPSLGAVLRNPYPSFATNNTKTREAWEERVAAARSLIEEERRTYKFRHNISAHASKAAMSLTTGDYDRTGARIQYDGALQAVLLKEKRKLRTKKCIRILRSRISRMKTWVIQGGPVGPWLEIMILKSILGPQVIFQAQAFDGNMADSLSPEILFLLGPSLEYVRLVLCPTQNCLDYLDEEARETSRLSFASDVHTLEKRDGSLSLLSSPRVRSEVLSGPSELYTPCREHLKVLSRYPSIRFAALKELILVGVVPEGFDHYFSALRNCHFNDPDKLDTRSAYRGEKDLLSVKNSQAHRIEGRSSTTYKPRSAERMEIKARRLEVVFDEVVTRSTDYIQCEEALSILKALIEHFGPTQLTVCPSPHVNLFPRFQRIVAASFIHVKLAPSAHIAAHWCSITCDVGSNTNLLNASANRFFPSTWNKKKIQKVTLSSIRNVYWLLQNVCCHPYPSKTFFFSPRTIVIERDIYSLATLLFAWDNFAAAQKAGSHAVERLFQSTIRHLTLCDLTLMFSHTLQELSVELPLPLGAYLCGEKNTVNFFWTIAARVRRGLQQRNCNMFKVVLDLDISLRPQKLQASLLEDPSTKAKWLEVHTLGIKPPSKAASQKEKEKAIMERVVSLKKERERDVEERFTRALKVLGVASSDEMDSDTNTDNEQKGKLPFDANNRIDKGDEASESYLLGEKPGSFFDTNVLTESRTLLAGEASGSSLEIMGSMVSGEALWRQGTEANAFRSEVREKLSARCGTLEEKQYAKRMEHLFSAGLQRADTQGDTDGTVTLFRRVQDGPRFEGAYQRDRLMLLSSSRNADFNVQEAIWDPYSAFFDHHVVFPLEPSVGVVTLRIQRITDKLQ